MLLINAAESQGRHGQVIDVGGRNSRVDSLILQRWGLRGRRVVLHAFAEVNRQDDQVKRM